MRKSEPGYFQLDVHVVVLVLLQYDLGVGPSVDSVRLLPNDYRCERTEPAERREEACLIGIARVNSRVVCKPIGTCGYFERLRSLTATLYLTKGLLYHSELVGISSPACAPIDIASSGCWRTCTLHRVDCTWFAKFTAYQHAVDLDVSTLLSGSTHNSKDR